MNVSLNGERKELPDGSSVSDLLRKLNLDPVRVAVEINEELVPRKQFAASSVQDGDRIEVVTFVGGG